MFKKEFKKVMSSSEMDLKPFMNLMVVLIPMLLVSAEFAKVAVVDIKLPVDRGVSDRNSQNRPVVLNDKLSLTAIIIDSALTIGAKGGFLPSIFYREFHQYIARDDKHEFTVEYKPGSQVYHPLSAREMKDYERNDIRLFMCDENQNLIKGIYNKYNELLTDKEGQIITSVKTGDTAYVLENPRRKVVIRDVSEYHLEPVLVYDELQNRLQNIRERFADASDKYDLIIAAENKVLYDKIIQIMDKAKAADYRNIFIARVRT
ncbi:MAG TPA: hypothetical protein VHP36_09860 [Chitinispirillaceae bacterium]|nr:hypothetical protein [Chitinispirillaceae bacterium]